MEPLGQASRPTPRRRAQNAASQRLYRARQKARLEQLQRLAVEALTPSAPYAGHPEPAQQSQQLLGSHCDLSSTKEVPNLGLSSYDILSGINSCSEHERQVVRWIIAKERFSIRDLVKFGLIQSGYAMDLQVFDSAEDTSARSWLEKVKSTVGDVDLKAVAIAGIRVLARLNVPQGQINSDTAGKSVEMGDNLAPIQTNLHVNRILLSRESLASAIFANASQLQIPLDDVIGADAEYASKQQDNAYRDLVPTANQLTVPHHPCFDAIPWAVFRSNLCFALSQDPPLVDDEELCLDIMNEGIRCWGTSKHSLSGRGSGVPWDARSWEAAPWFLEKWEPLTGGKNSDIWINSAWWRSIR